jgi:hypothetical protein
MKLNHSSSAAPNDLLPNGLFLRVALEVAAFAGTGDSLSHELTVFTNPDLLLLCFLANV